MYKIQVGAFRLKLNAEKQAAKIIEQLGIKTAIVKEDGYYKVQCGAFSNVANALNRKILLENAGYKVITKTIQDSKEKSEDAVKPVEEVTVYGRVRIWAIHFFDKNEDLYGDATVILQYAADNKTIEHCILIDTAMSSSTVVSKLKAAGVKEIDAVVISHGHGDHYGGLTKVFENFKVHSLYLPSCKELDKYQKSYGNAIRNQERKAKKLGISVTYLTQGDSFAVGNVFCDCIFQIKAKEVSEHDNHHYVNNCSIALKFTIDNLWTYLTMGDLQNAANNIMIRHGIKLLADIFKCSWHGDANATNDAIAKAVHALVAFSNYHHKERSGRDKTRKRLEKYGTLVMRNAEDGDIYFDIVENEMVVTCSKRKDFRKVFHKTVL